MALSAADRERFLTSLRSDASFRDEVRREVLTGELLMLPQRFAAFVEEMRSFVEATNRRFGGLESEMSRLKDDSGELRGMILEQKIRGNPSYYLRRFARRVKVVDVEDLLDTLGGPEVSNQEHEILAGTDVLARGVSKQTGDQAVFVVEATWRVHTADVERQVRRRQVLLKRGVDAVAVIASIEVPSEETRRRAGTQGVLLEPQKSIDAA